MIRRHVPSLGPYLHWDSGLLSRRRAWVKWWDWASTPGRAPHDGAIMDEALITWSGWIAATAIGLAWLLSRQLRPGDGLDRHALEVQLQEQLDGYGGDEPPPVLRQAARIDPSLVLAILGEAVPGRDPESQQRAGALVLRLDLDELLLKRLWSRRAQARRAAVQLVGCFRWARAQGQLLGLLDDPDGEVAAAAALAALRQVDDLPAVDGLRCLTVLQRRRPLAVAAAAEQLDEAGLWRLLTAWDRSPQAAAPLMQCLARRVMPVAAEIIGICLGHEDPAARRWACAAAAAHGASELLDQLRRLAVEDPARAVRIAAVDAMGALTDAANLAVLERAHGGDDPELRRHAERALAAHGPEGWQRLRKEA